MHTDNNYELIVREALKKYSLNGTNLVYLGTSDNVTFRLDTSDESITYLLKIHYSASGNSTKESIESELMWLEALSKDSNLFVPAPVRNLENELITEVSNETAGKVIVTCYTWVTGEILNRQPTSDETSQLALLMSALHKHSMQWDVPDGFERPVYNKANLLSSLQQIQELVTLELITAQQFSCLEASVHKIANVIDKQELTRENWGVIHSDLHESNYVFDQAHPRPIDFSACGYGFYLFDVAETFLHLSPDNRKVFISMYRTEHQLQEDYENLLEAYFIWGIIRNFAFHSSNPDEHEFLSNSIPFVIENYCEKYLKDKRFLFN